MSQIPIPIDDLHINEQVFNPETEQLRAMENSKINLGKKVYACVIENICKGKWMPGEKVTETTLAKELGISHVPVREAMEKLSQEGWVERIPNKGIYVKKLDSKSLAELFEIREMIELAAVKKIVKNITEEQLNRLRKVVDLREKSLQSSQFHVAMQTDINFHRLLIQFAANSEMEQMFESIIMRSNRIFFVISYKLPFYDNMIKKPLETASHEKILNALENHNLTAVQRLVIKHIKVSLLTAGKFWELYQNMQKINSML